MGLGRAAAAIHIVHHQDALALDELHVIVRQGQGLILGGSDRAVSGLHLGRAGALPGHHGPGQGLPGGLGPLQGNGVGQSVALGHRVQDGVKLCPLGHQPLHQLARRALDQTDLAGDVQEAHQPAGDQLERQLIVLSAQLHFQKLRSIFLCDLCLDSAVKIHVISLRVKNTALL